jgi:hypothetical protein
VKEGVKIVLSASRRTDIPAFYMDRFMTRIAAGSFRVENPFNRRVTRVPADPGAVHSIVFWSKNYGPFFEGGYGQALQAAGYRLFFNFTINSQDPSLEPAVPPLSARLEQLAELCRLAGSKAINWRFDPICFYRTPDGRVHNNLQDFDMIAQRAAACGIRRCITSFVDHYPKVRRRAAGMKGMTFLDPPLPEKAAILIHLADRLRGSGVALQTCCEKEVLATLPRGSPVTASACISSSLLADLFGGGLPRRRDRGQRTAQGCGCGVSVDIGSYERHPCFHNCLFCYANPREAGCEQNANRATRT